MTTLNRASIARGRLAIGEPPKYMDVNAKNDMQAMTAIVASIVPRNDVVRFENYFAPAVVIGEGRFVAENSMQQSRQ